MVPVAITREHRNHYLYWFICLYCSHSANKVLNIPSRGSFNSPAFINFLLAFSQLSILCSSILWRDGLCWLVFINSTTSLYLFIHRSSCVIVFLFRLLRHSRDLFPRSFSLVLHRVYPMLYRSSSISSKLLSPFQELIKSLRNVKSISNCRKLIKHEETIHIPFITFCVFFW